MIREKFLKVREKSWEIDILKKKQRDSYNKFEGRKNHLGSLCSQRCFPKWRTKIYHSQYPNGNDGCKERLAAATTSDISYFSGPRYFNFIREKSANFDNTGNGCGNHECMNKSVCCSTFRFKIFLLEGITKSVKLFHVTMWRKKFTSVRHM